jgi:hypothetical protein
MMGLEPTTFCMAKAGNRSHPFASVRSNHYGLPIQVDLLLVERAVDMEPQMEP